MHTSPETLALLALGEQVGTVDERDHAATCPLCSAELTDLTRLTEVARSTKSEDAMSSPSPAVWDSIQAELGWVTSGGAASARSPRRADLGAVPAAPRTSDAPARAASSPAAEVTPPTPIRRNTAGRRVLALAVAAALALVAGIGIDRTLLNREPDQTVVARADLAAQPQWTGASGQAQIEVDEAGNRTLVISVDVPAPVNGTRQVWLLDREVNQFQNLGMLSGNQGRFSVPNEIDLREFPIVDVSAEPDADPTHSKNTIVQGELSV